MIRSYDETTLLRQVRSLGPRQRTAFAVACAFRMRPYFAYPAATPVAPELDEALEALARSVDQSGEIENVAAAVAACEEHLDPDDNAVAGVIYASHAEDPQAAVWCARRAYEARDRRPADMLRVARRIVILAGSHAALALGQIPAASSPSLVVRGDTSGAPPSCSAVAAVAALKGWFAAVSAGDAAGIRANVSPTFEVFSAGRNGLPEPFFRADRFSDLVAYVTRRARAHERLVLRSIVFNGWHGRRLWFGPIAVERTADDVPGGMHMWIGKGVYECRRGLHTLNTAPWPENVPPFRY